MVLHVIIRLAVFTADARVDMMESIARRKVGFNRFVRYSLYYTNIVSVFCSPVCSKSGRYDLGLVIDGSGSVGNDGFADTKRFLLHMISQLPVSAEGTHYGIIVYSNDAKIIVRFSERWYHALLPLKLRVLGMEFPDGDTRTDKALKMAGTELYKAGEDRDQVPNVLVVITDGKTAQGSEPYKRVLKPLKVC